VLGGHAIEELFHGVVGLMGKKIKGADGYVFGEGGKGGRLSVKLEHCAYRARVGKKRGSETTSGMLEEKGKGAKKKDATSIGRLAKK